MTWGTSLAVQWLGPGAFTAVVLGSVPGWGTKILQAAWHGQKKKEKEEKKNDVALPSYGVFMSQQGARGSKWGNPDGIPATLGSRGMKLTSGFTRKVHSGFLILDKTTA